MTTPKDEHRRVSAFRFFHRAGVAPAAPGARRFGFVDAGVLSALAIRLPYEDAGRLFRTLVGWGRQADLFDHDPARGRLRSEVEAG